MRSKTALQTWVLVLCVAVTSVLGICVIAGVASRFVRLTEFLHGGSK